MTAAQPRRTILDDPTDAELASWPGVTWKRQIRGKHYALVLTFADVSRFVIYPTTPSDSIRGTFNHLATVRQVLREMGAERSLRAKAPVKRPKTQRTVHDGPFVTGGRLAHDPTRDPWTALKGLRFEPDAPPTEELRLSWWRRASRWLRL